MLSGHRQIDHTADLALEIWADTERELLGEGARALTSILTGEKPVRPSSETTLSLEGIDREDRLVQWLNEVLYLAVGEGFLFDSADIHLDDDARLEATVRGEAGAWDKLVTELKSVTYHDLSLREVDGGSWRAHIVVDV